MASKFHKNAILTGYIDYYCLVCESYIRTEEDADIHIEKPIHKKNLGFAVYFEKFKGDHIWKVKKGYFCEFCNKFLTTAAKVGLHVTEPTHNDNKGSQLLKRVGNSIIISNNTFINDKAWNGIISETCMLCNVEFYNENIHKTSQEHILNLILKKVEFITELDFYRKVDNSSFQCLTCNLIFSLETLNTHFKDENHIKNYEACSKCTPPTFLEKNKEEPALKPTMSAIFFTENLNTDADLKADSKTKSANKAKSSKTERLPNKVNPDYKAEIEDANIVNLDNKAKTEKPHIVNTDNKAKTEKPNIVNPNHKAKSSKIEKPNIINLDNKAKSSKTEKPNTVNPISKAKTEKPNIVNPNNEAKSLKTDKPDIVNPSITRNSKSDSTECDENSFKTKNNNNGNSNKAKCDKGTHFCKQENSDYETEFNPLMKDSVISGVVTEMKKLWKKEDKLDAKKSKDKVNNSSREQKKAKILDSVTEFQKNGVNVNFENDSVFCKKCFENVDFCFEAIERHIDEHKNKPTNQVKAEFTVGVNKNHSKTDIKNHDLDKNHNIANKKTKNYDNTTENNLDKALVSYIAPANASKTDSEKTNRTKTVIPGTSQTQSARVEEPKDPISYAKANHMTYNKGNSNAYCRICNARVPANLRNMKEHANGHVHKSRAGKVAAEKQIIPKKPMNKFITNRSTVANMHNDDVIVNDKFCMARLSYLMITENGPRLRCQACEVTLTEEDVDSHLDTCWHERAMEITPVVWSLHTEFVREVRPGLFHCGFCNLIVGPWEDVASHLKCTDHKENKEDAAHRLGEHLPGILKYRRHKERLYLDMAMRGFGFFF